jgi:hypothetical protein
VVQFDSFERAVVVQFESVLKGHGYSLRKKSLLHLFLGGAAVYRCDNCLVLNAALAAEGRQISLPNLEHANFASPGDFLRASAD